MLNDALKVKTDEFMVKLHTHVLSRLVIWAWGVLSKL